MPPLHSTLSPGSRLSVYEIVSVLGEGGMGIVYRARDTRLGRDVAIKLVRPDVAGAPDRLERFEREARTLASLNHPHVAHIYGLEEGPSGPFIVLEYIAGPTLADRLTHGAIPLDECLAIAGQIADALEAAHSLGIVHRDLKPANIKVQTDGTVKVLDFGLAKVLEAGGPPDPSLANSPTLTAAPHLTGSGVILGTAAYMAPEQAKGRPAATTTDVWAFGCVLYEMLTGVQTFSGDSVAEIIVDVMTSEPDWSRLPAGTPERVRRVLRRCLAKQPRGRLQHIGDARLELQDSADESPAPPSTPPAAPTRARLAAVTPWLLVGTLAVATVALAFRQPPSVSESPRISRLELDMPTGVETTFIAAPSAAISPDGKTVAFTGQQGAFRRVFIRRLADNVVKEFGEAEGASQIAFSPDSSAVAFVSADRTLKRTTIADSLTTTLVRGVDRNYGFTWGPDDKVTYVSSNVLWQMSGSGGKAIQITSLDTNQGDLFHCWPTSAAGGRYVFFTVVSGGARNAHRIDVVDTTTGARHTVVAPGTYPMVASSGHLVFWRDGALVASKLDGDTQTTTGALVRLAENVALEPLGAPLASLSSSGDLVYVSNESVSGHLVWVTRQGVITTVLNDRAVYDYPRISPDGAHISVTINGDIWQADVARANLTRVTAEAAVGNSYGVWTPDSRSLVFRSANGIRVTNADGGGQARPIPQTAVNDFPNSVASDGNTVVFTRQTAEAAGEVAALSLRGDANPHVLFSTQAYEGGGVLSPNRRWLAYSSNETGRYEIYVRSFPNTTKKWPASADGGTQAAWSRDGSELFYRNGSRMYSVRVAERPDVAERGHAAAEPDLMLSPPTMLFDQTFSYGSGITFAHYDVTADGRFLMIKRDSDSGRLNVVLNWTEELKRLTQSQASATAP